MYTGLETELTVGDRDKFVNNLVTLFTVFETCTDFMRAAILSMNQRRNTGYRPEGADSTSIN